MHLFITGISGFVGARLARRLGERGERASGIYVADRPAPDLGESWEVDLLDRPGLDRVLERGRPDAVVHLGGLSHVGSSWGRMADYFRVNVLGTENLLDAAAGRGPLPVVVASSAEVYGAVPEAEQPIAEERTPAPASPYALTKAAAERLALARGAVVVRSFNLVGAGQAPTFARTDDVNLAYEEANTIVDPEEFRDIWFNAANTAFKESMSTTAFAAATGQNVEDVLDLQQQMNEATEQTLHGMGFATTGDVREVGERLVEIERRQHAIEEKLDQLLERE